MLALTESQKRAVNHEGNALVVACPGSGKTRAILAKILRSTEEIQDTPRKLACITYTNAAVDEIADRLRTFGSSSEERCEISTIHSFCSNNILRPFHWRLKDYRNGFRLVTPDCEAYNAVLTDILDEYDLSKRDAESFSVLSRRPNGTPVVSGRLTTEIAFDFWKRLQKDGLIDYTNIVYQSYRILKDNSSLPTNLSCRFAWILLDEFQDTSELQVEILKLIASAGKSKFFVVGDPHQSIFGFAGARPDLMEEFSQFVGCEEFQLSGNFRSSEKIVDQAELLLARVPRMSAVGADRGCMHRPTVIHVATACEGIVDHFLPALDALNIPYGNAAILAPWWIKLLKVGRQLRGFGVPIIGPGSRPYKRSHLFAELAELLCAYAVTPEPKLIPRMERELYKLSSETCGTANLKAFSHHGRRTAFRLVKLGISLRDQSDSARDWLLRAGDEMSSILVAEGFLNDSATHFIANSVAGMLQDMESNKIDLTNLTVRDLGLFGSHSESLRLLTMHKSKGREFDAVALIDLHERRLPNFNAQSSAEIQESLRLFYVAVTRARKMLFYFTDDEDGVAPTRFLCPLQSSDKEIEL